MNDLYNGLAPHSVEAEDALLGSVLYNPEIIKDLPWLKPEDFFLLRNQMIYKTILIMYERKEQIDYLTFIDELKEAQQLEAIGGPLYIHSLMNNTPTWIHYYTYAEVVREHSRRRRALELATRLGQGALAGDADVVQQVILDTQALLDETHALAEDIHNYSVHVRDLKNLPPINWLIPGEIPEMGITMLFGPSGIGKSFVATGYAMSVAQERGVVYVAAEGRSGYHLRTAAYAKHNNVDLDTLNLTFFFKMLSLLDPKETQAFIDLYKTLKPALVIIDTLSLSMLPGDENNARDIALLIKASQKIQNALQCAILFVHHTGKEGKNYRGSSALQANCDVMIRLSGDDDVITVECTKAKEVERFPRRYIKLMPVQVEGGSSQVVMDASQIEQTAYDPITTGQQKVLEALALDTHIDGASTNDIVDVTELGRGSVLRMLSALLKLRFVEKVSGAAPYKISDSGRVALAGDSVTRDSASRLGGVTRSEPRQQADDSVTREKDPNFSWNQQLENLDFDRVTESDESDDEITESNDDTESDDDEPPKQGPLFPLPTDYP